MPVDISVLPGFIVVILLFLAPPGPDMAFMIAVGISHGRRAAIQAILGLATGMSCYAGAVVLGIGEVARSYPLALDIVKAAGALYLLWLAVVTFREARQGSTGHIPSTAGRPYLRGVTVSLTNLKVTLFFLAMLPQFMGSASNPTLQLAMLGATNVVAELVIYGALGVLAGTLHARFNGFGRKIAALQYGAAGVYLVLALAVVTNLVSTAASSN